MNRNTKASPHTFEHFPVDTICPICQTNDEGVCVLVPIKGTDEGGIAEAQPIHLACAVIQGWDRDLRLGWVIPREAVADVDSTISDGFGSSWSRQCPTCHQDTMEVVRPGKVQCSNCG